MGEYGLMRWRRGQGLLQGSKGSHLACFAQEKNTAGLAGSSALSQDTWAWTCLRTPASLGTACSLILMVSLVEVTQCTLTVKQCVIAVVKVSVSKEIFPARHLFPFSIYAFDKNLLGHLVANKNQNPYFNLIQGLWVSAHFFTIEKLPGVVTYADKSIFQNTYKGSFSLL